MGETTCTRLERTRLAAITLAAIAVGYLALSLFYFWDDFLRYVSLAGPVEIDRSGIAVPTDQPYIWTILSPWRPALALIALGLLGASATALWRQRPRARVLTLFTLWGVLLPQVLWYTELLFDWYHGQHVFTALLAAFTVVAVPTLLLYEGRETLAGWRPLARARGRLFAVAVSLGWLGFLATNVLDHSYRDPGWIAYGGALCAIGLSALAVFGILELRAWGLWAGVGAALALALVPLTFETSYVFGGAGYLDGLVASTTGSDLRQIATAALPIALVWTLAAPFLHGFVRKALSTEEEL